jgi:hypothetical protein
VEGNNPNSNATKNTLNNMELMLFPNPANDNLSIKFKGDAVPTTFILSNLEGKEMWKEDAPQFNGSYEKQLDLAKFPKGVYFLQIKQGDQVHSEKVVHD